MRAPYPKYSRGDRIIWIGLRWPTRCRRRGRTQTARALAGVPVRQRRATPWVGRGVEDDEPVEVGEALCTEREVGRIARAPGAPRQCFDLRGWHPLAPVRRDEHRSTRLSQPGFECLRLRLADVVLLGHAQGHGDHGVARPERLRELGSCGPPLLDRRSSATRWATYNLERQIRYNQDMAESLSDVCSTDGNTR